MDGDSPSCIRTDTQGLKYSGLQLKFNRRCLHPHPTVGINSVAGGVDRLGRGVARGWNVRFGLDGVFALRNQLGEEFWAESSNREGQWVSTREGYECF